MKTLFRTSVICLAVSPMLFSCQKEVNVDQAPQEAPYAQFKDVEELQKTIVNIGHSSSADLQQWEKSIGNGFVSMRSLFIQAEKERNEAFEIESKTGIDIKNEELKTIKENPNAFRFSDEGFFSPNVPLVETASVINKDGILKIGGYFLQYTYKLTKSIPDLPGRTDEIALLRKATQTDGSLQLIVEPVKIKETIIGQQYSGGRTGEFDIVRDCMDYDNGSPYKYRMKFFERAYETSIYFPPGGNPVRKFWLGVAVETSERTAFGAWKNRNSNSQVINGTFTLTGDKNWDACQVRYSDFAPKFANGSWDQSVVDYMAITPNYSYYRDNNSGSATSVWETTILNVEGGTCTAVNPRTRDIRFAPGSFHKAKWNLYDCECTIQ